MVTAPASIFDRLLLPAAPVLPRVAGAFGLPLRLPAGGVCLTFDDGPHPEGTPAILELLAAAGVRAIFFLVGEQVQRRPELAQRIRAAGHVLALHCHRHRFQPRLRGEQVRDDLTRGRAAIEEAAGVALELHRPPYGAYSAAGLDAVRAAGLAPLLWSRWGKDWRRLTTPARIAARATAEIGAGDVILLHDSDFYSAHGSYMRTAKALPAILATLEHRRLATVLPV